MASIQFLLQMFFIQLLHPQENYRNLQSQHINEVAGPDMIYFSPNRSTRIDHTNRINSFVVNTEDTIPYPYL